jgi:hypothetical protein
MVLRFMLRSQFNQHELISTTQVIQHELFSTNYSARIVLTKY